MAMVNVTPRRPSIIGIIVGAAFVVGGAFIIYSYWHEIWETARPLLMLFVAMFLLLFGFGILTASAARR